MNMYEYQIQALKTAVYPNQGGNLSYPVLGLCGEAGEVANKVKKIQRDHGGVISIETRKGLKKELGDVLWYLAAVCEELDTDLESVAFDNLKNLAGRQERKTINGSGDDR